MALAPVKGTDFAGSDTYANFIAGASTSYPVNFANNYTNLENVDMQVFHRSVLHKVQAKGFTLAPYVSMAPNFKGTFTWRTRTDKRDPRLNTVALPTIQNQNQEFDNIGLQCNQYLDDAFLIDFVVRNATVNIPEAILTSMYMGYQRLMDRICIAAMLQPQIVKTSSLAQVAVGEAGSSFTPLEDARIGGASDGSKLIAPSFKTFQKILRKFWDNNAPRTTKLYGLLTPGLEELMQNIDEYKDRDYVYHDRTALRRDLRDNSVPHVDWMGIRWVKIEPDKTPGAFYASKYLKNTAGDLQDVTDTAASNFDLTDSNHEAVPIWTKENIEYHHAVDLDQFEISRIGYYRNMPAALTHKWLGGCRLQNILQYVLLIPA